MAQIMRQKNKASARNSKIPNTLFFETTTGEKCPDVAECPQDTTVYNLILQPKWFRFTNDSISFYECVGKNENCIGG